MIHQIDRSSFNIPPPEQPATATRKLKWYATGDDAVLGVVILDVASETYAWAVLTEKVKGQGLRRSLPARSSTRKRMRRRHCTRR